MSTELAVGRNYVNDKTAQALEAIFERGAAKVTVCDAYWIGRKDDGEDYCRECAAVEITKQKARRRRLPKAEKENTDAPSLDGGWCTEHDSSPFCACGKRLECTLTDYGCRQELDHFIEDGFDQGSDDDCYSMANVISARGWRPLSDGIYDRDYERESERYFADLWTLADKILNPVYANANL